MCEKSFQWISISTLWIKFSWVDDKKTDVIRHKVVQIFSKSTKSNFPKYTYFAKYNPIKN